MSTKVIGRLCLYRRILEMLRSDERGTVFSHELAKMADATASQVRRDLMIIGYSGSSNQGYDVAALGDAIAHVIDAREEYPAVLVGVGHLGRAVLDHLRQAHAKIEMVAAFDTDPAKIGRMIGGTRVRGIAELPALIAEKGVGAAILTLPSAHAQEISDLLIESGVRSLLNFTNVRLRIADGVFVEDMDIGIALARMAYFGRCNMGVDNQ